jgi:hypothetical protein
MKRTFLTVLALGAALLAPQPASAAADSERTGRCHWRMTRTPAGDLLTVGVAAAVAVYSTGTPADNPVSATVTCTLMVNGVPVVEREFSGTGLVAGAAQVTHVAGPADVVSPCDTVDYTSNATPTSTVCYESAGPPPVPQPIIDIINALCEVSCHGPLFEDRNPIICPLLAAIFGEDGDVYVAGARFYDCPPYGDA